MGETGTHPTEAGRVIFGYRDAVMKAVDEEFWEIPAHEDSRDNLATTAAEMRLGKKVQQIADQAATAADAALRAAVTDAVTTLVERYDLPRSEIKRAEKG